MMVVKNTITVLSQPSNTLIKVTRKELLFYRIDQYRRTSRPTQVNGCGVNLTMQRIDCSLLCM